MFFLSNCQDQQRKKEQTISAMAHSPFGFSKIHDLVFQLLQIPATSRKTWHVENQDVTATSLQLKTATKLESDEKKANDNVNNKAFDWNQCKP